MKDDQKIEKLDHDLIDQNKHNDQDPVNYARQLIEASIDALVTIDISGKIMDVNKATEKATGLSRTTLIHSDFSSHFTNPKYAKKCIRLTLEKGELVNFDLTIKHSDGSLTPVLFNASTVKDKHGQIYGIFLAARDISALINAEDKLATLKGSLELLIKDRKDRTEELEKTKMLLKSSLDSPRDMIILSIDKDYNYLYFNQVHKEAMKFAYGKDIKVGMNLLDQISSESDRKKAKLNYDRALQGISHSTIEAYGDLEIRTYETFYNTIRDDQENIVGATAFSRNVSDRINAEVELKHQNKLFTSLLKILPVGVFMVDAKDGKPLVANEAAQQMLGRGILPDANMFNLSNVYKAVKKDTGIVYPTDEMPIILGMQGKESHIDDMVVERPDGTRSLLEVIGTPLIDDKGTTWASLVTFLDITERQKSQENLIYLSFHDQLTGLYNRRFFEEELHRLNTRRNYPITIVMGDVNGLKLVNDTFGHAMGDDLLIKVSNALKQGCRTDDIVARYGGDEFIIILPKTNAEEADKVVRRLKYYISQEKSDSIDISVSFGSETLNDESQLIQDIIKKTEDDMYQHKVYESSSMRSKTIDLIMKTLFEKNNREMLHSKRVSELCVAISKRMRLGKEEVKKIRLTGLMHDIGKIGINEKILNSTMKLDEFELAEIQKHSEIGSRILGASGEFSEIAEVVLQHHERWDGKGYPRGLKEDEISLHARIIAVADTFDAIVSERAYRESLSIDQAKEEIKSCAGTQFDPYVVEVLVKLINEKNEVLYHGTLQEVK